MCVGVHSHPCLSMWRAMSSPIIVHQTLLFKQCLSVNLEITSWLDFLTSKLCLPLRGRGGSACSCPTCGGYRHMATPILNTGAQGPNSGPQAAADGTLPPGPPLQFFCLVLRPTYNNMSTAIVCVMYCLLYYLQHLFTYILFWPYIAFSFLFSLTDLCSWYSNGYISCIWLCLSVHSRGWGRQENHNFKVSCSYTVHLSLTWAT